MKNKLLLSLALVLIVSSCTATDLRKAVGISKNAPDEFLVQPRQKLRLPESAIALPKPQEKKSGSVAISEQAREELFGASQNNAPASALEQQILAKTGANKVDKNIRSKIEDEYEDKSGVFGTERGGTMEAILDPFGYNAPVEPIVDSKKENSRIKKALATGQKVTSSGVKTKDPRKEQWEKQD
jgi:hypothetical protein